MSPASSLRQAGSAGSGLTTTPRRAARLATAAAVVAVALHLWALYRDHGPPTLKWFPQVDKVEHLVGFGLPCFLVLVALRLRAATHRRLVGTRAVALVVGLFLLHAGVSEVVQGELYTTRSGDPYDALADVVGTLLGLLAHVVVQRRVGPTAEKPRETGRRPRGRA